MPPIACAACSQPPGSRRRGREVRRINAGPGDASRVDHADADAAPPRCDRRRASPGHCLGVAAL